MVKKYGKRIWTKKGRWWVLRRGLVGQDRRDHRLPGRTSAGILIRGKFGSHLVKTFQWWCLIRRAGIMYFVIWIGTFVGVKEGLMGNDAGTAGVHWSCAWALLSRPWGYCFHNYYS